MIVFRLGVLSFASLAGLGGCSLLSLFEEPPIDGMPADELEACWRLSEILCREISGCCSEGTWPASELDRCRSSWGPQCVEELQPSVDSGRAALDRRAWGPCLDEVRAYYADCPIAVFPEGGLCSHLFVGRQERGDFCTADFECAQGLECLDADGDDDAKCIDPATDLPGEGESCEASPCGPGTRCDVDGRCHAEGTLYGACAIIDEYTDDCGEGLACNSDLVCVQDLEDGQECTVSRQCHSYTCEAGRCEGGAAPDEQDYCDVTTIVD